MSDGARLATRTVPGPAGAPAVILVHGGPGLWDYLAPLGALLAGRATVHRYDQRRCGSSTGPLDLPADRPAGPSADRGADRPADRAEGQPAASALPADLTMERSVQDLEELRLAFGHERIVLVGHSFGATLALAYAGTHPGRVAALGYVDGVGVGDWRTPYRAERDRRRAPWAERFALLDGRERTPEEEVEWRRIQWATDYTDPAAGYDLALDMARSPHPINHQANRALAAFDDMDQISWATAVRCPLTLVHGTADPRPMGPVVALGAHARAPRKRVVPDAGHLPWVEQPERMEEILAELVLSAGHRG
jgi:proline iminopeptidase